MIGVVVLWMLSAGVATASYETPRWIGSDEFSVLASLDKLRGVRCCRVLLAPAVLEVPTKALGPTGVFVPPPQRQQDHAQNRADHQELVHRTLTVPRQGLS